MFACVVSLFWNVIVIVVLLFMPTPETFAFVAFTAVSFQLFSEHFCKRLSRFWCVVLLIVAWYDCGRVGISKIFIELFRDYLLIHLPCEVSNNLCQSQHLMLHGIIFYPQLIFLEAPEFGFCIIHQNDWIRYVSLLPTFLVANDKMPEFRHWNCKVSPEHHN